MAQTEVLFYDQAEDSLLKFAVVIAREQEKWLLCRHRERDTWEFPGGHREPSESILETARRELWEETGATDYSLETVCAYSVRGDYPINREFGGQVYGMLYFAVIRARDRELHSEIEEVKAAEELPEQWTYPDIQPGLLEAAISRGFLRAEEN